MAFSHLVLLLNAATTLPLVGLIWIVQAVHYPLFAVVGAESFRAYHASHGRRITPVVAPLMLGELAATACLLVTPPTEVPAWMPWLGAALVAVAWVVTFGISVPCHVRLSRGFDPSEHRRLVRSNWLRTAAWSARGALILGMIALVLAQPQRSPLDHGQRSGDGQLQVVAEVHPTDLLEHPR
jgi:hypothetical protein